MPDFSEPPSAPDPLRSVTDNKADHKQTTPSKSADAAAQSVQADQNIPQQSNGAIHSGKAKPRIFEQFFKKLGRHKSDSTLRHAIEEAMVNGGTTRDSDVDALTASHERLLITNILHLRDMTAVDVMIPRADIVAVEIDTPQSDLLAMLSQKQNSRFPVYRETLDDVVGTIHMKDILATLALGQPIVIADLIRSVPIVSPSLPVLDLLVQMRESKKHMALVVDEYGGIDGLVTIGDIIEAIIGEINDEYDNYKHPQILEHSDGSIIADGRVDIEEFEDRYGKVFDEDEREDIDTLGGLVFALAGRVPARGEVLSHESGIEFEVLDADPRRINRLKIRNIPPLSTAAGDQTRH